MSVSTNDLKNGMTLDLDGTLFQVVEFQHVKPGKGGAFVTIEPGVYLPALGGVRIEDAVEVTDDGSRPLGTSTRELIEL